MYAPSCNVWLAFTLHNLSAGVRDLDAIPTPAPQNHFPVIRRQRFAASRHRYHHALLNYLWVSRGTTLFLRRAARALFCRHHAVSHTAILRSRSRRGDYHTCVLLYLNIRAWLPFRRLADHIPLRPCANVYVFTLVTVKHSLEGCRTHRTFRAFVLPFRAALYLVDI